MSKTKYYVVWKGRKRGIYSTWEECSAQVTGFTGAEYKAFESRPAAEAAYNSAYTDFKGKRGPLMAQTTLFGAGGPVSDSYCVDASCLGNPGRMEYRCVHTKTGKELFHQGPYENGTNNIGEFLAITHALALFKDRGLDFPLYSDSKNALLWVKTKKCKTKLVHDERNAQIFVLIAKAEEWLRANPYSTRLLKWKTEEWGEIPADFGRK
jgi:ribonuclease HI